MLFLGMCLKKHAVPGHVSGEACCAWACVWWLDKPVICYYVAKVACCDWACGWKTLLCLWLVKYNVPGHVDVPLLFESSMLCLDLWLY